MNDAILSNIELAIVVTQWFCICNDFAKLISHRQVNLFFI